MKPRGFSILSSRRLLIFVFAIAISPLLRAQENLDDVVYLKNGTFLRGKIIELIPEKSLKFCVLSKDTMDISMNDVKLIKREKSAVSSNPNYEDGVKAWGYTNITEVTLGWGLSEINDQPRNILQKRLSFQLSTINGLTLSPYIHLGLGTGVEFWNNRGFIPIFLDLRTNLLKKKNTPFGYLDVGYSPGWINGEDGLGFGGALVAIGVGAKISVTGKMGIVVSLGYRFQQTRQWQANYNVRSIAILDTQFIALKAGVLF